MAFDLDILQASCCGVSTFGVTRFASRVAVFPAVVIMAFCSTFVLRRVQRVRPCLLRYVAALAYTHAWHTVGVLGMAFCIPIVSSTLMPFRCLSNP